MISYDSFVDVCEAQDVQILDDSVQRAGWTGEPPRDDCYCPTGTLAAIAAAGNRLRRVPDAQLITRRVQLPEPFQNDIGVTTLANILNATIANTPPPDFGVSFTCAKVRYIDTCSKAELAWADTLAIPGKFGPLKHDIITDDDKPVLLRKVLGEPSALSLCDVHINGIPYPAGSILRTDFWGEDRMTTKNIFESNWGRPYDRPVKLVPLESVTKAAFMRLSTYALTHEERGAFLHEFDTVYLRPVLNFLAFATIDEIRDRSQLYMERVAVQ